jgi:hypothetical protein
MNYMATWTEDFSTRSTEYVLTSEAKNRSWGKELRLRTLALVNSRLAQQIGADEYALHRKTGNDDAAEFERRKMILFEEIRSREDRRCPPKALVKSGR